MTFNLACAIEMGLLMMLRTVFICVGTFDIFLFRCL
jgi:hypothetical protein